MATILEIAADARLTLEERERAIRRLVIAAYGAAWLRLRPYVDALIAEVEALPADGRSAEVVAALPSARALVRRIDAEVRALAPETAGRVSALQQSAYTLGAAATLRMIESFALRRVAEALPGQITAEAAQAIIGLLRDGTPLAEALARLGPVAAERARAAIVQGAMAGLPPHEIEALVRQAVGTALDRSLLTVRSEMMRAYRTASFEAMAANSDVVSGWVWVSRNDDNVCPNCLELHGSYHTSDEMMLQAHPACRCTAVPWYRYWRVPGAGEPAEGQPHIDRGADWFARQDAATQRKILGPAKHLAYQRGELTLADLFTLRPSPWGEVMAERSLRDVVGEKRALELIRDARTAA